jgi:hypothetical protein
MIKLWERRFILCVTHFLTVLFSIRRVSPPLILSIAGDEIRLEPQELASLVAVLTLVDIVLIQAYSRVIKKPGEFREDEM